MTEGAVKTVPFIPDDPNNQTTVNQNNHATNVDIKPTDGDVKTPEELAHEAAMIKKAEEGTNTASNQGGDLFAGKYKTKEEFDKAILSAYHKKHGDKVEDAFKQLTGDLSDSSNASNDQQTPEEKAAAEKVIADKAAADKAAADADTRTEAQKLADAAKIKADADAQAAADAQTDNNANADNALNEDMETYVGEFNESGKLSDASYGKLAEAGFEKPMVDTYMSGIAAQRDALFSIAGGKESFFQMTEWAAEDGGMAEADVTLFNDELNSGDMVKMQRAVTTLKTAFTAAGKRTAPGRRIEPTNPNAPTGITGYTHLDQFKADQRNPEYKKSAAFRAEVKEKLRLGSI